LITSGRVARPWLGISGISITPVLSEGLGLGVREGVLVVEVVRGSPAHQAKLRGGHKEVIIGRQRLLLGGDIITSIGDRGTSDMKDLVRIVGKMKVGQTVTVHILRDNRSMDVNILLAERP
jgi:S1-C subfamily serine protease